MSWVFNKMSKNDFALAPKCHGACLQRHETCIFDVISILNNVAPKCRVVSLQRLGTIPSIVENDNHCAKATLKTLIIILITIKKSSHVGYLNNIIRYENIIHSIP